ncbi:MAG: sigma-70 family RNA polymerase sigma factor [Sedimentibacter sp.]
MFKELEMPNGISTTIEITEEGKVTYCVGKKKTTFDLSDCDEITYEYSDKKTVITEDMLSGTDALMWIIINEGENRLEYNNNKTETRRHNSYSNQNDKWETLTTDEDVLDIILHNLEKDVVKKAISKLEPKQQELILDIYYRGLSMADVARRDGVYKSSVTKRMTRIIQQLKKNLKNF